MFSACFKAFWLPLLAMVDASCEGLDPLFEVINVTFGFCNNVVEVKCQILHELMGSGI